MFRETVFFLIIIEICGGLFKELICDYDVFMLQIFSPDFLFRVVKIPF